MTENRLSDRSTVSADEMIITACGSAAATDGAVSCLTAELRVSWTRCWIVDHSTRQASYM